MNQHQDRKLQRTQFCWVIVKTLNISNESRWKNSCQSSMQKIYWFSYFNAMRLKVRSASNEWGYFIYFRFSLESHEDNCQQQQYLCQWNEYHLEKTPFPRFTCVPYSASGSLDVCQYSWSHEHPRYVFFKCHIFSLQSSKNTSLLCLLVTFCWYFFCLSLPLIKLIGRSAF